MSQIGTDPLAEVKTETACFFIRSAGKAGITPLKNTWEIFGRDPNSGILNTQNSRLINGNRDAAGRCVFY